MNMTVFSALAKAFESLQRSPGHHLELFKVLDLPLHAHTHTASLQHLKMQLFM